ncbi:MAG: elongation factor P [Armatimonadetes bacterium]|nr:elongation factor P [Armatimonadota bacterium]
MIDTSDFRTGLTIQIDNEPYTLIYFQHVKPGKGGAFVRTKLKSVRTGNVFERTFRAGEKFEPAYLERQELEFIYRAGEEYFLMDTGTYDQRSFTEAQLGAARKYLKEGMKVSVLSHNGEVIGVEIPDTVELEVVETDPGLRGDTASGGSKPATLETGAVVQVPLFVGVGESIRVDTRTDSYLERVKKA